MLKLLSLSLLALTLAGCASLRGPHQEYTAPAASGRVVDSATGQPIKNARVARLTSRSETQEPLSKTAGERLIEDSPAVSGEDGTFYIPALRSAYLLFGSSGSLTLTLRAERSGYQTMVTNIDLVKVHAVKTDRGPEVRAGDLRLQAKP